MTHVFVSIDDETDILSEEVAERKAENYNFEINNYLEFTVSKKRWSEIRDSIILGDYKHARYLIQFDDDGNEIIDYPVYTTFYG